MPSVSEMYYLVTEYCNKQRCPKTDDGTCELESFCREPESVAFCRRLPDILGMDLEVAYDMVIRDNPSKH